MDLDEALAQADVYAEAENEVFVIDAETRTINVPASESLFGVKGDKNIERKYFRCPKIVGDNVDLSKHMIYIAYVYTERNTGSVFPTVGIQPYHCDDVEVDGDDITFSWKLSENVFQSAGFIAFKMYAKEKEDSPYTVFNTAPAIGTVLYTIGDGVESVVSEYPDVINQLLTEMESVQEIATPTAMQGYVNEYLTENPVEGGMTEEQEQQLEQNTSDILLKLNKNQGEENAGKSFIVGEDGDVTLTDSYFEVEGVSTGAFHPEQPPTTFAANENWSYSSYGSEIYHGIGNIGCVYNNMLFTGTVYVRGLQLNRYSDMGCFGIYASDTDVLPKDWTRDTGTVESLTPDSTTKQFLVDGTTNYVFIKSDGSYVVGDKDSESFNGSNGWIYLRKYTIPEGKYGWLVGGIVGNQQWNVSWNQYGYPAVFDIDPSDNIVQSINESASPGQLQTKSEYTQGFMKFLAGNSSFQSYISEYIDNFIPLTSKRQTFGKAIYIGGDSLHAYAGGDGFSTSGFVTNWNKYLGFSVVTNAGYAGSKWSETTGGGGIKRVKDLISAGTVYDVIILAWGTNDDTGGNGTIDDVASDADGATMVAAMKWIITNLRNTFKNTSIGVIIPPPKNAEDGMKTRGDLMIQVCELLHVPYVDMRQYISISDLGSDTVHLGTGAGKYGAAEASLIMRICQYGDTLYPGT